MRDSKIKTHEAMALVETQTIDAKFDASTSTVAIKSPYNPVLVDRLIESGLGYFDEKALSWIFPLEQMESVVQAYNEHYPDQDLPAVLLKRTIGESADDAADPEAQVTLAEIGSMGSKAASIFALAESYSQAVARLVPTLDINVVAAASRDFGIYPIGWESEVTKLNALLSIERYKKDMTQEEKNKVLALQRFLNGMEEAKFRGIYSRDVLNHLVKPAGLEVTKTTRIPRA